jgi:thymidine kinase
MEHKICNSPGLDIILGPMYSGKSSELLRRLFTVTEVGLTALYINNALDSRNIDDVFSSHNPQLKSKLSCDKVKMIKVKNLSSVDINDVLCADIIGVDEAQFYPTLDDVKIWIEKHKKRVVVTGLDGNYNREKFGCILDLIPWCDSVVKLTAYCVECSAGRRLEPAIFSHCIKKKEIVINVGAHDKYISLCRKCYLLYNQNQI